MAIETGGFRFIQVDDIRHPLITPDTDPEKFELSLELGVLERGETTKTGTQQGVVVFAVEPVGADVDTGAYSYPALSFKVTSLSKTLPASSSVSGTTVLEPSCKTVPRRP